MDQPSISLSNFSSSSRDYFPSDVLKRMKANASPKMALKLMQICKYFQHKIFPFVAVENIILGSDGIWRYSKFKQFQYCEITTLDVFKDKSLSITGSISIYQNYRTFCPLFSKMAISEARSLDIKEVELTIAEFKELILYGKFKIVKIVHSKITDSINKNAALESILECLQNVEHINIRGNIPSIVSLNAVANISLPKLKLFHASHISENFDFDTFTVFMKAFPLVQYRLYFGSWLINPQYIRNLNSYVEEIIIENSGPLTQNSLRHPPPDMSFPGNKYENVLNELSERYFHLHKVLSEYLCVFYIFYFLSL